jgi:hypothetical protein
VAATVRQKWRLSSNCRQRLRPRARGLNFREHLPTADQAREAIVCSVSWSIASSRGTVDAVVGLAAIIGGDEAAAIVRDNEALARKEGIRRLDRFFAVAAPVTVAKF